MSIFESIIEEYLLQEEMKAWDRLSDESLLKDEKRIGSYSERYREIEQSDWYKEFYSNFSIGDTYNIPEDKQITDDEFWDMV